MGGRSKDVVGGSGLDEAAEILFAHSDEVAAIIRQRLDNHVAPDAFVLLAWEQ